MYRREGEGGAVPPRGVGERWEGGGRGENGEGCGWRTMGASILLSCGERGAARQCGEEGGGRGGGMG